MSDSLISWIDFDNIRKTYIKQLPQALTPDEFIEEFKFYLSTNKKYNIFGLATHFGMSKLRFTSQYLNSKDELTKNISQWAVDTITNHAMSNEEDYARTLRYIIAQSETNKSFIELSEEVKEAAAKVIILPEKK
jgi:hypothetical protein